MRRRSRFALWLGVVLASFAARPLLAEGAPITSEQAAIESNSVAPNTGEPLRIVAAIRLDWSPTSFLDRDSGKPAGFAVDVMDAVALRAGLEVAYVFVRSWAEMESQVRAGTVDVLPDVGINGARDATLDFTAPVEVVAIHIFVRAEHPGLDAEPGVHTVGVIEGGAASEALAARADVRLVRLDGFGAGLLALLGGQIDAFAGAAPSLWHLAREIGVEDRIKVVDRPVAELQRAIAVRKGNLALLTRLNQALEGFVGTPAYRQIHARWYGRPTPYWTPRKVGAFGGAALLFVIVAMAVWRHASLLRLNRELRDTMALRRRTESELERTAAELNTFFEVALDLLCVATTDGRFLRVNPAWERTLGLSRDELLGGKVLDFVHPDDREGTLAALADLAAQKDVINFVNRYRCRDGSYRWIEWRSAPSGELVYAAARDITEHKQAADITRLNQDRLESLIRIAQRRTESMQELLDVSLEEAIRLTASRIGYIYFYSEATRQFTLNSWSRDVMTECTISEPLKVHDLDKTGIWGEAVRQRRPIMVQDFAASHPLKKGYPEGHAPLLRFLTVPVFADGEIVAVVGVANKLREYDDADVRLLTLLMDDVWRMAERKRTEQEREALITRLQKALTEIKTLHGILPICSSCKKIRDDKGSWTQIEAYISKHTEAEFSHGLCQECLNKLYPDFVERGAARHR